VLSLDTADDEEAGMTAVIPAAMRLAYHAGWKPYGPVVGARPPAHEGDRTVAVRCTVVDQQGGRRR
jgi:hypothetical protein